VLGKLVRDHERPVHARHEQLAVAHVVSAVPAVVGHVENLETTDLEADVSISLELDRRDRGLRADVDIELRLRDIRRARAITLAIQPLLVIEVVGRLLGARGDREQRQRDQPAGAHPTFRQ
jgi:hypothetical protein